jgi:hypothetical protein
MVTREDVVAEILKVPEKHLDEIYRIIRNYEDNDENPDAAGSVMSELRKIRIAASPDFSLTANLYDLEEPDAG